MNKHVTGPYILVHDIGTTSNKAVLFDISSGLVISSITEFYDVKHPKILWAEQDPKEWWNALKNSTKKLLKMSRINPNDIIAVSFSGQMMSCLSVNKKGDPLLPAIIWMDQRSINEVMYIKEKIGEENFYKITGNRLSPTYPIAKILWLKNNKPRIYEQTFMFLQPKDFIIMKLTGTLQTDYSDASLTGMMNIVTREWSSEILSELNIDDNKLPPIKSSLYIVGEVTELASKETSIPKGTPVVLGGGDGACATLGGGAIKINDAYIYIGASAWLSVVTNKPIFDSKMRIFNMAHIDQRLYSPIGTMQTAGASLKWFRDNIFLAEKSVAEYIKSSSYEIIDIEASHSPPGSNGLIYLPYLMGERSPWWNPYAKGTIIGITLKHTRNDLARSLLEGISYNLKIILNTFEENEIKINEPITLIGGGGKSVLWAEILSHILNYSTAMIKYPEESTALGAAITAAVATKYYKDVSLIKNINKTIKINKPNPQIVKKYKKMYDVFVKSYYSLLDVFTDLSNL
jgi:xylulokinase